MFFHVNAIVYTYTEKYTTRVREITRVSRITVELESFETSLVFRLFSAAISPNVIYTAPPPPPFEAERIAVIH